MQANYVTPRVGVWIETSAYSPDHPTAPSLPAWECGLKHHVADEVGIGIQSLPAWECGLKLHPLVAHDVNAGHSPRGSVD